MTRHLPWALSGVALVLCGGCGRARPLHPPTPAPPGPQRAGETRSGSALPQFSDVTQAAGISFVHTNGASGRKYMPETMGAGCAFLDFDGDGWLDILLLNGRPLSPAPTPAADYGPSLALYRNNRDGRFSDVTVGSGLERPLYAMGCCVGDYDNDGRDDLFITTCNEANRLFHNEGDGALGPKFRDVTEAMGVGDRRWGTSCAWLDYDRDGFLDLFVCNYVRLKMGVNDRCANPNGGPGYCPPDNLPPDTSLLYHNDGGRPRGHPAFRDVTRAAGIGDHPGKALGVAVGDYDGDGWPDLFVANDKWPNFLFHNRRGDRFEEIGLVAGIAYPENGDRRAGMGIDLADIRNNGRQALLISNFSGEGLSLFYQDTPPYFLDVSAGSGISEPSRPYLGFGLFFFDYDNDGWQDAFVANGHIQPEIAELLAGITYGERNLLFRNRGAEGAPGAFAEEGAGAGPPFVYERVSRGAACGDYDNDGDLDILLANNNQPAELLRNEGGSRRPWLQLELRGRGPRRGGSNRSGIGALAVVRADGVTQRQWVHSGSSYCSQSMLRLHFGLGQAQQADEVQIRWPSGQVQVLRRVPANQRLVVQEP